MVNRHIIRSLQIMLGVLLILGLLTPSNLPVQAGVTSTIPKVGLITDGGPIDDSGFNQMAYEGLTRAENEGLIDGSTYIPTGDPDIDYAGAIEQCVSDGNALCITVGFVMGDATMAAADTYPGVHFAIVDMTWEDSVYPANLRGLFFAVDEAAYLAGTLAGMMSTTNCIGAIGGMSIPPVDDFIFPFTYAAQWADPGVAVLRDYADSFVDEELGADLAEDQISRGADVIFGVGGMMGQGAVRRAAELGKYIIGVDSDVYLTAFDNGTAPGADKVLTSVIKRVDNAVYHTIQDQVNAEFSSGTTMCDLANGGVGLAPYHEAEAIIPPEVVDSINEVTNSIINGTTDVWAPLWTSTIFLPMAQR